MFCREDLLFWEHNTEASPSTLERKTKPWDRDGKAERLRFVPVVIEVREKEIRGSVDGETLKPVTETMVLDELLHKPGERPRFPQEVVAVPAFGNGIGIFLQNADCVVRNLTVSKLNP